MLVQICVSNTMARNKIIWFIFLIYTVILGLQTLQFNNNAAPHLLHHHYHHVCTQDIYYCISVLSLWAAYAQSEFGKPDRHSNSNYRVGLTKGFVFLLMVLWWSPLPFILASITGEYCTYTVAMAFFLLFKVSFGILKVASTLNFFFLNKIQWWTMSVRFWASAQPKLFTKFSKISYAKGM